MTSPTQLPNTKPFNLLKALSPLDIVTVFYILISTLYMFIGASKLQDMASHENMRGHVLKLGSSYKHVQRRNKNIKNRRNI